MSERTAVRLEPWGPADLPLLRGLHGDPAMMEHLGGAESEQKLVDRQARYEVPGSGMFRVVDVAGGEDVYEIGWAVLPAFQSRGVAAAATAEAIGIARAERDPWLRALHAFPSVENGPSNAICRKLGFRLIEECEFEYPPGRFMRCNDWRLEL